MILHCTHLKHNEANPGTDTEMQMQTQMHAHRQKHTDIQAHPLSCEHYGAMHEADAERVAVG